jgi:hypothetical protein
MPAIRLAFAVTGICALAACAVPPPSGPRVMALPGAGKDFAAFQQDDANCRGFASYQTGGSSGAQAATNNALGTTAAGTVIGAGLGAALGSLSGHAGPGAVVGAVGGTLVGGSAAANGAGYSAASLQQSYDVSYTQCMYSRGDSVQNPPGGYAMGGPYPGYYGPGYVGGPTIVFGTGYGWRHHWRHW